MILMIDDIEVKVAQAEPLVSSSVNIYEVEFRFDGSWDGYTKTAVFEAGKVAIAVVLVSNKCTIPWEVLQRPAGLKIGVYGIKDDKVRPTLWSESLNIAEGVNGGDDPQDPTPIVLTEDIKKVLDSIGDIDAALDELHNYAQSLVGGATV